ncbi:MAG TPA: LLM class flavin-dependent oxidoreductase [Terrimesophilobacter sp.]|nr:LLM class flavin-dependent oxidoreductase [Terrimesophilobacter sp.]
MTSAPPSLRLSVLDLVPVRQDQTSADAVAASVSLAVRADELGFERYWLAEHHNMPAIAASSPPVMIAVIASRTSRMRVGSGGVMLPNHSPLVVAEQFAALEAAFPGRIDLGLGRAPGSDPVITALLRMSGTTSDVDAFPANVRDIMALVDPEGATLRIGGDREYPVAATPRATTTPDVWLLGSSDYSARLAAGLGLPYVFAHHFSGTGTEQALELYRSGFQPSAVLAEPRTFLTVNAIVADTDEEAHALALPQLHQMVRLRSGLPLTALPLVEEAAETVLAPQHESLIAPMAATWVIGAPEAAASSIRSLAQRFAVDEVMVSPVASARAGSDPQRSTGRERTLELLAAQISLEGGAA